LEHEIEICRDFHVGIGTLLVRADANAAIGTGHVMRSIALAEAWQDAGGEAAFAMAQTSDSIRSRIANESWKMRAVPFAMGSKEDLQHTIALAQKQNCEWVVVDGYQFDADYQSGLKAVGLKVVFLDDYGHSQHYSADVVLNQNLSANRVLYSNREPGTQLLLGPRYALLRREFNAWRDWERRISPSCRRVLVTMGGSDDRNVTATVIKGLCLSAVEGLEATVLVGGSNPHLKELQDIVARSVIDIRLLKDVSNVGELMASADIAVSAAGTTCWELCLLGLPSVLVDVADNQTDVAKELHTRGCAIHIGRDIAPEAVAGNIKRLLNDQELRQSLSRGSRYLVDGKGATRVVSVLRGVSRLRLRIAQESDQCLLWDWANDPEVRVSSFSPDPIPWETHVIWFNAKLSSQGSPRPRSVIFIAEDENGTALGQIRFDLRIDGDWDVGVSLDKKMRGQGLAAQLIESGVQQVLTNNRGARIHAFVKPENLASVKAFERAAFRNDGRDQLRGHAAIHLTYNSN
jgi:UDP-2,4-diacetamido-2,4,6-trideoxy-beta-L-altropyranose hydrolase